MKKEKSQKNNFNSALICVIVLCVVIFGLILFFTTGKTTTTAPSSEHTEFSKSVACESSSVDYPLFEYDSSNSKTLQINAVFKNDKLDSVSLMYKLVYDNKDLANKSESINHAAMNVSFGQNGLGADALGATYGKSKNNFQMSIYATDTDLNGQTLKYFMLDSDTEPEEYSQEKLAEAYNSQGLKCNIKNNDK